MSDRRARFDGIAIGEVTISFLGPPKIAVKAAFVNKRTGATHGWTTHEQWSAHVIEKLGELRKLMELDLERIHFSDALEAAPEDTTSLDGIFEHITAAQAEAPSL